MRNDKKANRISDVSQLLGLEPKLYGKAKSFLRPLSGQNADLTLPRDEILLKSLEKWLNRITLAGNEYSFSFDREKAFQLSNIRPDLNAYVIHIENVSILKRVLQEGKHIHKNVLKKYEDDLAGLDIVWGSLYWMRQIKRPSKPKDAPPNTRWLSETYWLVIFVKIGNIAVPMLRVYHDSIGLHSVRSPSFDIDFMARELDAKVPLFIDSHREIVDWHDLADRFGMTSNLFYLRCCFSGESYDVVSRGPGLAVVYRRSDDYSGQPLTPVLENGIAIGDQASQMGFATFEEFIQWANATSDLRKSDLSAVNFMLKLNWYVISAAWPAVGEVPRPEIFPEDTNAGQEFLFFVRSALGDNVLYIDDGQFQITYEASEDVAALVGETGGSWILGIIAQLGANPVVSGPAAGGVAGAIFAGKVGDAITKMRRKDRDRVAQQKRLIEDGVNCSNDPDIWSQADCRVCVDKSGNLSDELSSLQVDALIEGGIDIAGGTAIGCGIGAAIGVWFFGIGAVIGCAIGAIAGLLFGGGLALFDYFEYEDNVNTTENSAYGPCDSLIQGP